MLLYGDAPSSGEPTLEMFRRALDSPGAVRDVVAGVLSDWGWADLLDDVEVCARTLLRAIGDVERLELVAVRRRERLTVELHCMGTTAPFHELVSAEHRIGIVDQIASLWGVRPMGDGEAVWFEFWRADGASAPAVG